MKTAIAIYIIGFCASAMPHLLLAIDHRLGGRKDAAKQSFRNCVLSSLPTIVGIVITLILEQF